MRSLSLKRQLVSYLQLELKMPKDNLARVLVNKKGAIVGIVSPTFLKGGDGKLAIAVAFDNVLEILFSNKFVG